MRLLSRINALTILALIGILALLEIYGTGSSAIARFIPSPSGVLISGQSAVTDGEFWVATLKSNFRVLAAFFASVLVSWPIALISSEYLGRSSLLVRLVDFLRYVPVAAIVPLSIIWIGIGDSQKIFVLFFGTVFQMFVLCFDAAQRVPYAYRETGLALGFSRIGLIRLIYLPASLPEVFDAARVGMGLCWSYLLVAEIVAAQQGLGYLIIRHSRFLRIDDIFFVVLFLAVLGLTYDRLFTFFRPRLFKW